MTPNAFTRNVEGRITFRVFIIYDSKYGNTKRVAKAIAGGLLEVGIECDIGHAKEVDLQKITEYDALIFGAPNHMGKPSRTIMQCVNRLADIELHATYASAFDTYFMRERYFEKAMKKLEKHINNKLPKLKMVTPGLSIKVNGVSGPIAEGELPKAKAFGQKIANQLDQK